MRAAAVSLMLLQRRASTSNDWPPGCSRIATLHQAKRSTEPPESLSQ